MNNYYIRRLAGLVVAVVVAVHLRLNTAGWRFMSVHKMYIQWRGRFPVSNIYSDCPVSAPAWSWEVGGGSTGFCPSTNNLKD